MLKKIPEFFFTFPNPNIKTSSSLGRRFVAWKKIVGTNYDDVPIGETCVCSDHFHSGKLQLNRNTQNFYLS